MIENDTSTVVEGFVPEIGEVSLRQNTSTAAEYTHDTLVPTWAFVGQYAMPNCEHLIPFRI